jgi:hypothetical protein
MPKPAIGTMKGPAFTTAAPAAAARVAAPAQQDIAASIAQETMDELEAAEKAGEKAGAFGGNVGDRILSQQPPRAGARSAPAAVPPTPPQSEPEVVFSETEKPAKRAPEMKHVKVRSTVDIMAELEALRKRATTQAPLKGARKEGAAARRDVHKALSFRARELSGRVKSLRIAVSFEGEPGVLDEQEQVVDLNDDPEAPSVNIDLKIDLD